jgi:hypothetical protein
MERGKLVEVGVKFDQLLVYYLCANPATDKPPFRDFGRVAGHELERYGHDAAVLMGRAVAHMQDRADCWAKWCVSAVSTRIMNAYRFVKHK